VALAAAKIARPWNLDGTLAFGARVHCPVLCYPLVGLCLGSGFAVVVGGLFVLLPAVARVASPRGLAALLGGDTLALGARRWRLFSPS
jgi:hypothetical protein